MKIDDTYRSFLIMMSLGVNHGLLEFIKMMNETMASIERNNLLKREYELLSNLVVSANNVNNVKGVEKAQEMDRFLETFERAVADGSGTSDSIKRSMMDALEKAVVTGRNHDAVRSFEEAIDGSSITEWEKAEYKAFYRNAVREADRHIQPFCAIQIDVDDNRAAPVAASVEKQLRDEGIPAIGFYHNADDGKCFIHVFDDASAARAKAMIENELCLRAVNNVRSEASLRAIAAVTRQETVVYTGLTKAEAGRFAELSMGRHFPVHISQSSQSRDGSYEVMFLEKSQQYAEKLLAEAVVQTGGYSEPAGFAKESEAYQDERERVDAYLGRIFSGELPGEGENLGYLVDASPRNEGNRIVFSPDSITHINKDGKTKKITRDENPMLFEDRVRETVGNFAKQAVLIPAEDARKLSLYNENFKLGNEAREYIKNALGTKVRKGKEIVRKATIEQRFLSYAIKGSSGRTAREILCGIRDNLDELSASFRDTELKKIENRLSAALKDPASRDAALSQVAKGREQFEQDFDLFFNKGRAALETHFDGFLSHLGNKHVKQPEMLNSAFTLSKEEENMLPQKVSERLMKAFESIDGYNGYDGKKDFSNRDPERHGMQQGRASDERNPGKAVQPERSTVGTPSADLKPKGSMVREASPQKDLAYYANLLEGAKKQISLKTGLPSDNRDVAETARKYTLARNTLDYINGESGFLIPQAKDLYVYANTYTKLSFGKWLTDLSDEERNGFREELSRVVMKYSVDPETREEESRKITEPKDHTDTGSDEMPLNDSHDDPDLRVPADVEEH